MEKNPIDKLFEDKLKDYNSTPALNLWDRIEKQIPHEQKEEKSFLRRFWWLCLLLFIPMSIGIWYMSYEKNTTQKSENMATHINAQKLVDIENNETKNIINSGKKESEEKIEKTEETKNNFTKKEPQDPENKEFSINQKKNEKNIQSEATSEKEISSTNQKAEEKEVKQNSNEKTEEKVKEETKKTDTAKPQPAKKGVKVIIKLSEPEEPKEGKARDFASTKAGKFWKKVKKIKNGDFELPKFSISQN